MTYDASFRVWRGDAGGGALVSFAVEVNEGEVVLDIIHRLQATQAPDLAVRWNCKAGKCGSCSAEVNGRPRLLCMTRMSIFAEDETITVTPMRAFPVVRDLVTDVSFNYDKARQVPAFSPPDLAPGDYRMAQVDVERSQEFRKCIECFLCQDVCHVVRDHEENKPAYSGPRYLMRIAELDMHPLDQLDRRAAAREEHGLGQCNITKCCTRGLPRAHPHHRQRADPPEGARRRPHLRSRGVAGTHDPAPGPTPRLTHPFFERPVLEVAPDLLGAHVSHRGVTIRLTEVEAYDGPNDPGSHAYRGLTPRTGVMFGPPGGLYVYFSYGMHWCANLVCGSEGTASAVLMRAGEVVEGIEVARSRRGGVVDRDLARGPARLAQALGLSREQNGLRRHRAGRPVRASWPPGVRRRRGSAPARASA